MRLTELVMHRIEFLNTYWILDPFKFVAESRHNARFRILDGIFDLGCLFIELEREERTILVE